VAYSSPEKTCRFAGVLGGSLTEVIRDINQEDSAFLLLIPCCSKDMVSSLHFLLQSGTPQAGDILRAEQFTL
jgi:hypothetical protein